MMRPSMLRPIAPSLVFSLLVALVTAFLVLPSVAAPRTVEEADGGERPSLTTPRARILTGHIRRDHATLAAIQMTSDRRMPTATGADRGLRLVLSKSRYRLDVFEQDRLLKVYPVGLGDEPAGQKVREGDSRTPEGDYLLIPHHPSPNFGGCFYVCYPGLSDARRGIAAGLVGSDTWRTIFERLISGEAPPPSTGLGGLILIHGTKDRSTRQLTDSNWTQGCVAMENQHLLELLAAFSPADRPVISIRR